MKHIKIFGLLMLAVIGLISCTQDDDFKFTAQEPSSGISFTNTFLESYVLTPDASGNLGERFTWNSADYGVPTLVNYKLQKSITGDFTDAEDIGETNGNELAVTIGQLLSYATELGLDNDPNTEAPDTGVVSFRLKASVGTDALEVFSPTQELTLYLPEQTSGGSGIAISTWGVVGSGYNDWGGAGLDGQFYTTDQDNVLVAYVTLIDGEIKFRQNNSWDAPNINYGDTGADGSLDEGGDNIAVTAGNYKITIDLSSLSYTIEKFSWGVVGSGYNNWGSDGPDAKFYYDYTTDTFKVGVKLIDGEIKFRQNNSWDAPDINYGDTGADGSLDEGGDNIAVTAGYYAITLDFNNNTYTIEAAALYGVVGSGYNNWGSDGPDFTFTEVNPGIWIAEIVPLVDGEIKFRQNESWDAPNINYGDTGADGNLDEGGDNIAITSGDYRIQLNLNDNTYALNKVQ